MNEQLPAPEFDSLSYSRPDQKWICGKKADGECCRIGPDPQGRCRATFECTPALDLKEGATKGRYRCTRTKEQGGPCPLGPLPTGECCRPIPRCQPVRSLRAKRALFTRWIFAGTAALLLILLSGPWRWRFVSPGELSAPHSGASFMRQASVGAGADRECVACHRNAGVTAAGWLHAAWKGGWRRSELNGLASATASAPLPVDLACLNCHPGRDFHQPNVVRNHSCSACHQEHRGDGPLNQPSDNQCASCHADPKVMEASFQKGRSLGPELFHQRSEHLSKTPFVAPRPERGYTQVLNAFAVDHPDFRVHSDKLRETNTLRFNHARHFAADIPTFNGKKLECAVCHQPDASGAYHEKPAYETHCKRCHSLQFDPRNPTLLLPHGNPAAVRAFLRSLPIQYADHGRREHGLVNQHELDVFAERQLRALREEAQSEQNLEDRVFFGRQRPPPEAPATSPAMPARRLFNGCVLCHEVLPNAEAAPRVTIPMIPDRWLFHARFNHDKHASIDCRSCHDVLQSRETSDILLPHQSSCVSCHSPQGGVANNCSFCHSFHRAVP